MSFKRMALTAGIHTGLSLIMFTTVGETMQLFGRTPNFFEALIIFSSAFWVALAYLVIKATLPMTKPL